jgi:dimethylglycine dehydrogenase
VWGQRYGWERPNWFAPKGIEPKDVWSFRRSNYFEHVGNECRLVRERAAIIDITSFTKHEVSGAGAEAYLDRLVARRLPKKTGRISLSHALTPSGGVRSEFTITRFGPDRFYLISSGAAERYDNDLLLKNLPDDGTVRLENMTSSYGCLVLVGPRSRNVLAKLTDADVSNEIFPWLTAQEIIIGVAPVRAMRVNFVGELGWELHHPIEYQIHLFDALLEAGAEFGIGHCGMRAMDSLRIEKSYRMWAQDLTTEYSAFEAGLDRFIHLDKGDFVGRDALVRQKQSGVPQRFITLEVDAADADPLGNEPLYQDGAMVGRTTAGAYGHVVDKSLALAYVKPAVAAPGTALEIEILGDRRRAKVIKESPWDPENARLRA